MAAKRKPKAGLGKWFGDRRVDTSIWLIGSVSNDAPLGPVSRQEQRDEVERWCDEWSA